MSNERIDEILEENRWTPPNMIQLRKIRKAMGQIYLSGKWDGTQEVHKTQYNDYNRLRSLVKAQKELIEAVRHQNELFKDIKTGLIIYATHYGYILSSEWQEDWEATRKPLREAISKLKQLDK